MLLSIIIPYYKTLEETKVLLNTLIPQLNDNVEVLLIDDGCNESKLDKYGDIIHILHLHSNSGTASVPRNVGLEIAQGKYIAFIDSDDMVSNDYVIKVLNAIKEDKDVIYLSWRSKVHNVIMGIPKKWNCSVWCRVFKKEIIGNVRFKEDLKIAEDWVFIHSLKPKSSIAVKKQIYFYNLREGSLTRGGKE